MIGNAADPTATGNRLTRAKQQRHGCIKRQLGERTNPGHRARPGPAGNRVRKGNDVHGLWQELDLVAQNPLLAALLGGMLWFVQLARTRIPELTAL